METGGIEPPSRDESAGASTYVVVILNLVPRTTNDSLPLELGGSKI